MRNEMPAERPKPRLPRPTVCRTSDLEFDHGPRAGVDHASLFRRWRTQEVEEERGLRADVYRSLGLM
jgi:hypothetical protein